MKVSLPTDPSSSSWLPYSSRCGSSLTGETNMADPNGAQASAPVPAQEDDYAYRSFHEYRWDLDKDFLVSPARLPTNRVEHPPI